MIKARKQPTRFHKYRAFDDRTIQSLVDDTLWFADPATFNDPLDTRPTLNADLGVGEMEKIFTSLVRERVRAETTDAARRARFRGPKTDDHILRQCDARARHELEDIRYNATNSEAYGPFDEALLWLLTCGIQDELLARYDRGIFSLSERFESPLMWSHYGDQHRGLCIGYSVPEDAKADLHKVDYTGGRLVNASDVAGMLAGKDEARRSVDAAVLRRKAPDWRYEREWRLVGPRGVQRSQLELETITFGMRCSSAVQHAVVSALKARERSIRFYEIYETPGSFQLKRRTVDLDELEAFHPTRNRSRIEDFDTLEPLD